MKTQVVFYKLQQRVVMVCGSSSLNLAFLWLCKGPDPALPAMLELGLLSMEHNACFLDFLF